MFAELPSHSSFLTSTTFSGTVVIGDGKGSYQDFKTRLKANSLLLPYGQPFDTGVSVRQPISYPAKEENEQSWAGADPEDLTESIVRDSEYPVDGAIRTVIVLPCSVVVKVIRAHAYTEADQREIDRRLRRESNVWSRLRHPNVVPILGTTMGFGIYKAIVTPLMNQGSLNHYLNDNKPKLDLRRRLKILTDIAEGLSYLHAQPVVHGDLTTTNILMDDGNALLADFGLSQVMAEFQSDSFMTCMAPGTPRWTAPELYLSPADLNMIPEVTTQSDIYSFGSVALQVISGSIPYEDIKSDIHVIMEVMKGRSPSRPLEPLLSDELWNFIGLCWTRDPGRRPGIDEVRVMVQSLRYGCSKKALAAKIVDADQEPSTDQLQPKEDEEQAVPAVDTSFATLWASTNPEDLTDSIIRDSPYAVHGGSYADVFSGTLSKNGLTTKVAVKVIRAHTYSEANRWKIEKRLRREIRVWSCLRHRNVVPLLGTTMGFGPYKAMVSPWMNEGNLNHYLKDKKAQLNLRRRLQILTDIVEGLSYFHAQSVVHGDLTTANILMNDGKAHLTDVGLSNIMAEFRTDSFMSSTVAGAPRWAAPELFHPAADPKMDPEVTKQCDIYSFGSVALQVISGRIPYEGIRSDIHVIMELMKGHHPPRPSEPLLSDKFWNFIVLCWHPDPSGRPTIEEVREMLWDLRDSCSEEELAANVVDADTL